jgi:hypothetical protein
MLHDLWEMDPTGECPTPGSLLGDPDIDGFKDEGLLGGYGYPNPILTARAQAEAAEKRGEAFPLTVERMVHDVYFYEAERRKLDVGYSFPSFEERYGYPDPRPRIPEDERPRPAGA